VRFGYTVDFHQKLFLCIRADSRVNGCSDVLRDLYNRLTSLTCTAVDKNGLVFLKVRKLSDGSSGRAELSQNA
jgi:hypothetical protein